MGYKHGFNADNTRHPLCYTFTAMKQRCYNKSYTKYKDYGGRGITICDEWLENSIVFIEWSLENGWKKGLQIDRIDNDKGYFPENVRFVTQRENLLNKRTLISTNKSGYCGVNKCSKTGKWIAKIYIRGTKYYLGYYVDKKVALEVRNNFIRENNLEHEYKIQEWKGEIK